jgi:hypothetical protein
MEGIRAIIWKFLFDRGIKRKGIKFWQHNQTGHIA